MAVFTWVLERLAEAGLVKGKTVGVDATTLEANAAMRSIKRRDTRKRVLIQAAGCNRGLLRCLTGVGTPWSLQGWALSAVCGLIGRLIDRWGRLTDTPGGPNGDPRRSSAQSLIAKLPEQAGSVNRLLPRAVKDARNKLAC